ncbi:MAG: type 4a pilus biogenesis protein PilO [Candidatus Portnoybacteria bacterium]|nr:type 4a pilus biogenesis protein PilO [Candidatus Portnoybacteria bacterium]
MNRKNIIILISLISALVLVFVFLDPLWSSIKVLRNEINQKKLALLATEELLAKTQELDQEYQPLAEQAQKVLFALPKEKDIPHLLTQFDALAASNGLLLESMSFVQVEEEEVSLFPSLFLKVKVSGSYDAFKGYLTNLENSVRSMDVHSIKFAVPKEGLAALGIFEFDLGVTVYYHGF